MFNTYLVHPIFNLLVMVYAFVHDFGLAILLLTVIIRLILWPLVTRQLHSQKALQELQPELARIKKEAAGDRQKEGQLTMELYKEREINPFASFLPLLIQLPILFALFYVLRNVVKPGEIARVSYGPVAHLPYIANIISGKTTFNPTLLGLINLTKASIFIAAFAAIAQFIQTKQLQPKQHQPGDSQAQMMNSMIYVFPAVTFFFGMSLPAALTLYWGAASVIAILQQYLVLKRDVRELEAGTPTPPDAAAPAPAKPLSKKQRAKAKARKGKA